MEKQKINGKEMTAEAKAELDRLKKYTEEARDHVQQLDDNRLRILWYACAGEVFDRNELNEMKLLEEEVKNSRILRNKKQG